MAKTPPFRVADRPADGMEPDRQEEWADLLDDHEWPDRRAQHFQNNPVGWWSNYWAPTIVDEDDEVTPAGPEEWRGVWMD